MNALITGGAGFVGSFLAREVKTRWPHATVVAFDNLRRRGSELNIDTLREHGVNFVHGDIRNMSDLQSLRGDFDLLVDASAEPSVHAGLQGSPEYVVEANLMGTFNCLNFARGRADKFVLLSTSRVYSIEPLRRIQLEESETRFRIAKEQTLAGVTIDGISEDFPTNLARSFYGASKLAAESLTQEFSYSYGLKSIVYRCGVIAGPGQFGKVDQGVVSLWVASHYFGKPLQYTGFEGTGKQVRDVLHVRDACGLVLANLEREDLYQARVFNIGGGNRVSTSLVELTAICQAVVGKKVPIGSVRDTAAVDIPLYISDCRRSEAEFAWQPSASMETIVGDTFEWIRQNERRLVHIFG